MSVDSQLLQAQQESKNSKQNKSAETAGALREAQSNQEETSQESGEEDINSLRKKAKRKKQKEAKLMSNEQEKTISVGTSRLLQSAWRSLIPSWGFSFLYVYVHLFLQSIFGKKLFAPLGSEWFDKPGISIKKRDRKGGKLRLPESIGVGCCTIVIFFSVIFIFSILALMLEVIGNPLSTAIKIGWSWLKNKLSGPVDD